MPGVNPGFCLFPKLDGLGSNLLNGSTAMFEKLGSQLEKRLLSTLFEPKEEHDFDHDTANFDRDTFALGMDSYPEVKVEMIGDSAESDTPQLIAEFLNKTPIIPTATSSVEFKQETSSSVVAIDDLHVAHQTRRLSFEFASDNSAALEEVQDKVVSARDRASKSILGALPVTRPMEDTRRVAPSQQLTVSLSSLNRSKGVAASVFKDLFSDSVVPENKHTLEPVASRLQEDPFHVHGSEDSGGDQNAVSTERDSAVSGERKTRSVNMKCVSSLDLRPPRRRRRRHVRGAYKCSLCGEPKKNHVCKFTGMSRAKKRKNTGIVMRTTGSQASMDPQMTVYYLKNEKRMLQHIMHQNAIRADPTPYVLAVACTQQQAMRQQQRQPMKRQQHAHAGQRLGARPAGPGQQQLLLGATGRYHPPIANAVPMSAFGNKRSAFLTPRQVATYTGIDGDSSEQQVSKSGPVCTPMIQPKPNREKRPSLPMAPSAQLNCHSLRLGGPSFMEMARTQDMMPKAQVISPPTAPQGRCPLLRG